MSSLICLPFGLDWASLRALRSCPFVTDSGYVCLGGIPLVNIIYRLELMGFENEFIDNLIII